MHEGKSTYTPHPDTQAVSYGTTDSLPEQVLGIKVFNCDDSPCSLLGRVTTIHNRVTTGQEIKMGESPFSQMSLPLMSTPY